MLELGLLLLILLSKAQKSVFSPTDAAATAAAKKKEAEELARQAREAAARGEAEKARQKAKEAQAKHQEGTALEQAAKTPVPWPQALPGDLPPFPAGWTPAKPVTAAMVTRAFQLLPELWARGVGTWKAERTGTQWVVYQAQQMGAKRGVVAFVPRTAAQAAQVQPTAAKPATASPGVVPAAARPAPAPAAPVVRPAAAPAPLPPTGLPLLYLTQPRMRGPAVIALQQRLGLVADGIFGPATDQKVRAYQAQNGLVADGKVGELTWRKLGLGRPAQAA